MTRYDALMDLVLRAGLADALTASGFQRRRPRLFVREWDRGYDHVHYSRGSKRGGEDFTDRIGVFYRPVDDLYKELFPDGTGDPMFPNPFVALPAHVSVTSAWLLGTTCQPDLAGLHAYRIEEAKNCGDLQVYTPHSRFADTWYTERSNAPALAGELADVWREVVLPWLERAQDMTFAASWLLFDAHNPTYAYCHAATLYGLAGDHRRARLMLVECLRKTSVPLEAIEMRYRGRRLLGLLPGRPAEEARRDALVTFKEYRRVSDMARRLAVYFGHDLPRYGED